jgi:hypothetical protein
LDALKHVGSDPKLDAVTSRFRRSKAHQTTFFDKTNPFLLVKPLPTVDILELHKSTAWQKEVRQPSTSQCRAQLPAVQTTTNTHHRTRPSTFTSLVALS